jgi:hypothetical protein
MALTVLTIKTIHALQDSSYGTLREHAMDFLFNAPPASTSTDAATTIQVCH